VRVRDAGALWWGVDRVGKFAVRLGGNGVLEPSFQETFRLFLSVELSPSRSYSSSSSTPPCCCCCGCLPSPLIQNGLACLVLGRKARSLEDSKVNLRLRVEGFVRLLLFVDRRLRVCMGA